MVVAAEPLLPGGPRPQAWPWPCGCAKAGPACRASNRRLVAAARAARLGVLGRILGLRAGQPLGHCAGKRHLGFDHAGVAHRLVLRRVGFDLGAVQRNMAESSQASLAAQCRHGLELQPLSTSPRDPIRRIDATAIGAEQPRHHHRRMTGRVAARLGTGTHDCTKIQFLADKIADHMGRTTSRDEISNRRRKQPDRIGLPGAKHFAHEGRESPCATHVEPYSAVTRTHS